MRKFAHDPRAGRASKPLPAFLRLFRHFVLAGFRKGCNLALMQLTDEQVKVRDNEGFLTVVTARAGSGKTATMVEKIRAELARGTAPEAIAAMTYTVTAAREIQHRLGVELGHCGTLHGYAMRELRIDPTTVADEDEVAEIVQQAFASTSVRGLTLKAVADAMESPTDPPGDAGVVLRFVRAELKARGRTTFSLILRAYFEKLKAWPTLETKPRFAVLIVDEAQDTAPIDAEIYMAIDAERRTFIGDPLQAIFGFRGCTDRFFRKMARQATDYLPLSTTFRCRKAICDAANRLLNGGPISAMRTIHTDGDGYVTALRLPNEAAELREIETWARQCYGTRAVLCRYNADVARVGAWLLASGIKVRMRRPEPDKLLVAALRLLVGRNLDPEKLVADYTAIMGARAGKVYKPEEFAERLRDWHKKGVYTVAQCLEQMGVDDAKDAAPPGVGLGDALEAALRGERPGEADASEVVVGTIHSAKGREFDDVLVASCYAPGKMADADEEARIFYVAITRARNSATATFAERRIDSRTMAELAGVPSPFIAQAGIEICTPTH